MLPIILGAAAVLGAGYVIMHKPAATTAANRVVKTAVKSSGPTIPLRVAAATGASHTTPARVLASSATMSRADALYKQQVAAEAADPTGRLAVTNLYNAWQDAIKTQGPNSVVTKALSIQYQRAVAAAK